MTETTSELFLGVKIRMNETATRLCLVWRGMGEDRADAGAANPDRSAGCQL